MDTYPDILVDRRPQQVFDVIMLKIHLVTEKFMTKKLKSIIQLSMKFTTSSLARGMRFSIRVCHLSCFV